MTAKRNYQDPLYKEWRRIIRKRDGRKCQMPKCKRRTYLQVHHIRKWANAPYLRYDTQNGILLCRSCHSEVTGKEHLYEVLFMDIVRANSKANRAKRVKNAKK